MLEPLSFALGLVNNLALIAIFTARGRRLDLVQRYGWVYLLLSVPAAYGIFSPHRRTETAGTRSSWASISRSCPSTPSTTGF